MIPNNQRVATIDGSLGGERIQMGFHKDAITHLMTLLTDLYTDQELACIREYSTNAWDAHIDAGNTAKPIEVTTPTMMNPYLKIKDYGVGMFADTIRKVYSQYGASTKRQQTDTNGSMGIGGKAALSLSSQFSVVAVRDGIKTYVSVSRNADGSAFMEIIDESVTTEPNGVEIIIPVNSSGIKSKAESFFQYWEKGRVLLNGVEPSRRDQLIKTSDRIYFNPSGHQDIIFMGNVPYPVKNFDTLRPATGSYVVFVTMNGDDEVVFVPSREALMYNSKTNDAIDGIVEELNEQVLVGLRKEMNECKTKAEAFNLRNKFLARYQRHTTVINTLTFNGEAIPDDGFNIVWDRDEINRRGYGGGNHGMQWNSNATRYAVQNGIHMTSRNAKWIVVNYTKESISHANKQKIRQYVRENHPGESTSMVFFVPNDGSTIENREWIENKIIDWEEIRKIRLEPTTGGYGGRPMAYGGYHVLDPNTMTRSLRHDLTPKDAIVYFSPKSTPGRAVLEFIAKQIGGAVFVEEPVNRHAKLLRLLPESMTYYAALDTAKKNLVKSLTDDERKRYAYINDTIAQWLFNTFGDSLDKIDDPDLVEYAKMGNPKTVTDNIRFANVWSVPMDNKLHQPMKLSTKYPMVGFVQDSLRYSRITPTIKAELVEYINTKFAKENS